jgi:hypothetical protein
MDQTTARRRAKELGGIAVGARWNNTKGAWILGGWANHPEEQWIVVNPEKTLVLEDDSGRSEIIEIESEEERGYRAVMSRDAYGWLDEPRGI